MNWENTYTFDSLGRVTTYTYSGCFVCSNLSYSYNVTYNAIGQVDRISNKILKDGFTFYYNPKGDIIRLEKYLLDKVETVIELTN